MSGGNAIWPSSHRWDTRVVYIEKQRRWWWNAWLAASATELYGFADSQEDASRDMYQAIQRSGLPPA